jgi:hypothetical protein
VAGLSGPGEALVKALRAMYHSRARVAIVPNHYPAEGLNWLKVAYLLNAVGAISKVPGLDAYHDSTSSRARERSAPLPWSLSPLVRPVTLS